MSDPVVLREHSDTSRSVNPPRRARKRYFLAASLLAAIPLSAAALEGASSEGAPSTSLSAPTSPNAPKTKPPKTKPRIPDVVYVPTPQAVVDKMLELTKPKKTEVVYDLGCGDGRIVITAAKRFGTKAIGFDIDPMRVAEARENVKKNKLEDLVTIEEQDIFTLDLTPADVVTLYLLPELNVRLIPQLQKLKPGSRVVSHDFDIQGIKPKRMLKLRPKGEEKQHLVYLFGVPLTPEAGTTPAAIDLLNL